jgi:hypothetical protein
MSSDDYEVGYKKPPKKSRFKPGSSGNPKGRPKGSKNLSTILRQRLNKKVQVAENGRRKLITVEEVIVARMVTDAAAGDPIARRETLRLIAEEGTKKGGITILYLDEDDRNA